MAIGAFWWLAGAAVFVPSPAVSAGGAAVSAVCALANDIDSPRAPAANVLWPLSNLGGWALRKTCGGHRGITHSIPGTALLAGSLVIAFAVQRWPWWIFAAVLCGWCSHIGADSATESGERLWWPFSQHAYHLLPKPMRVRVGLRKMKRKRRKWWQTKYKRTAEWALVRPAAYAGCAALAVLVITGR